MKATSRVTATVAFFLCAGIALFVLTVIDVNDRSALARQESWRALVAGEILGGTVGAIVIVLALRQIRQTGERKRAPSEVPWPAVILAVVSLGAIRQLLNTVLETGLIGVVSGFGISMGSIGLVGIIFGLARPGEVKLKSDKG